MTSAGKILITGGTGLIGGHLIPMLQDMGYGISVLSRNPRPIPGAEVYRWDPAKDEIDKASIRGISAIIHLAGAGIGEKRWTKKRKREIFESRITPVHLLAREMQQASFWPETFISASGINLYDQKDPTVSHTEQSPAADSFLARVVAGWEDSVDTFTRHGVRTVKLRTGLVLDNRGGALPAMVKPVQLGLGTALGSGKQRISWIHIRDICRLYCQAIEDDSFRGAYNCVAPDCVSNQKFMEVVSQKLRKPLWPVRIPGFLLTAALGEMASLLLEGSCIINKRLAEETRFRYQFPDLETAIDNLYPGRG